MLISLEHIPSFPLLPGLLLPTRTQLLNSMHFNDDADARSVAVFLPARLHFLSQFALHLRPLLPLLYQFFAYDWQFFCGPVG